LLEAPTPAGPGPEPEWWCHPQAWAGEIGPTVNKSAAPKAGSSRFIEVTPTSRCSMAVWGATTVRRYLVSRGAKGVAPDILHRPVVVRRWGYLRICRSWPGDTDRSCFDRVLDGVAGTCVCRHIKNRPTVGLSNRESFCCGSRQIIRWQDTAERHGSNPPRRGNPLGRGKEKRQVDGLHSIIPAIRKHWGLVE